MKKHYLTVALLGISLASLQAQSFYSVRRERTVLLTVGTGTSTYLGELTNKGDYLDAQPNINVGLQYYLTDRISLRTELNWFVLSGDDKKANDINRTVRNLQFKSSCFEYNVVGQVNLYANGNRYYRRPAFNIYGFAGIGVTYFNPKATYQGTTYSLAPLHTEGKSYSRVTPVIPFGLGIRFKVSPQVNIAIEGGFRKTFTDYLDDVSGTYIDNNSFTDPIAKALADRRPEIGQEPWDAGHIRGNPKAKDVYMLLNVKVEWYLPWAFGGSQKGGYHPQKRRSVYNKRGGLRR